VKPLTAAAVAPEAHRAFAGRRALVMGLGSFGGGAGAARYLAGLGARVLVTDLRPPRRLAPTLAGLADLELELVLGEHRPEDFERADLVVVNPAVRPSDPLLDAARRAGARLTSEIELFLEALRARVVAITGTQGKSSTAHATHALLKLAGRRAHLGGNIGRSLLPALPEIRPEDLVVLELSSYQLESLAGCTSAARAEAVAVLNVLPDHLERHGTLEAYAAAKRRILELLRPGGHALLPGDDPRFASWEVPGRRLTFSTRDTGSGLHFRDGWFRLDGEVLARVDDLALPGEFQRANALVALGLGRLLGLCPSELAQALPRVRGLEHRLQDLGVFRGRRVIDNAVSTTPDSTISALRALPQGTVLVLGGKQKRLPLDELARVARERVAAAVAFGEAGAAFAGALRAEGVPAEVVPTVEEAVARALEHGRPGSHVLFSPAGSSFDAYANFQERAVAFRAALRALG
jgi:UDP-N-acetylmuramoylalanine--D-glutamate ligase